MSESRLRIARSQACLVRKAADIQNEARGQASFELHVSAIVGEERLERTQVVTAVDPAVRLEGNPLGPLVAGTDVTICTKVDTHPVVVDKSGSVVGGGEVRAPLGSSVVLEVANEKVRELSHEDEPGEPTAVHCAVFRPDKPGQARAVLALANPARDLAALILGPIRGLDAAIEVELEDDFDHRTDVASAYERNGEWQVQIRARARFADPPANFGPAPSRAIVFRDGSIERVSQALIPVRPHSAGPDGGAP